jgi:hypothetical protein
MPKVRALLPDHRRTNRPALWAIRSSREPNGIWNSSDIRDRSAIAVASRYRLLEPRSISNHAAGWYGELPQRSARSSIAQTGKGNSRSPVDHPRSCGLSSPSPVTSIRTSSGSASRNTRIAPAACRRGSDERLTISVTRNRTRCAVVGSRSRHRSLSRSSDSRRMRGSVSTSMISVRTRYGSGVCPLFAISNTYEARSPDPASTRFPSGMPPPARSSDSAGSGRPGRTRAYFPERLVQLTRLLLVTRCIPSRDRLGPAFATLAEPG